MKKIRNSLLLAAMLILSMSLQSFAQGSYEYQYDENNRLIRILQNGTVITEFLYDENGSLFKTGSNLSLIPRNLKATNISDTNLTLSWESNNSATSYIIYKNGIEMKDRIGEVNLTYFQISNLSPKTEYMFYVQAVNRNNQTISEFSVGKRVITSSKPIPKETYYYNQGLEQVPWREADSTGFGDYDKEKNHIILYGKVNSSEDEENVVEQGVATEYSIDLTGKKKLYIDWEIEREITNISGISTLALKSDQTYMRNSDYVNLYQKITKNSFSRTVDSIDISITKRAYIVVQANFWSTNKNLRNASLKIYRIWAE